MSSRPVMWNYDKPHRCPECHGIWTYRDEFDLYGVTPRWWKTYTCQYCETKFTGRWAWWPRYYHKTKFAIWRTYRNLKWRLAR